MKRHGGLQWAVVNVLVFWESGSFEWIGCCIKFESLIDGKLSSRVLKW